MTGETLLTLTLFLPLAGGVVLLLLPRTAVEAIRLVALVAAALSTALSLLLLGPFEAGRPGFQLVTDVPWIPAIGVGYRVGVDGLSLPLVILTGVLTVLSIVYSWRVEVRVKEYMFLFLLLQTAMVGVFVALDLFLFFIVWE
ncbi:MAG: hypothetical protein QN195_04530, partial [Armatimonadota bacterium]|nr:hypothetical protein [Armatimonadota bacterium]MDR7575399.1 hypothetical protein [Armatimonadota bacterium]